MFEILPAVLKGDTTEPILQTRKLRLSEAKKPPQGHIRKLLNENLNIEQLEDRARTLLCIPCFLLMVR